MMDGVVRHRGLARAVCRQHPVTGMWTSFGVPVPWNVVLECGHEVTREQYVAWQGDVDGRRAIFCQVCAASPHPITNPDAWARMPFAAASKVWKRRVAYGYAGNVEAVLHGGAAA